MSIGAMLKNYLTKKGFEKYKGSSTYYKVFSEKYWAIAELYRDKNHCVYNRSENCFYNTNGCFYDIHVDIWHEALNCGCSKQVVLTNYNAGNSICQLSGSNELNWVNFDGSGEQRIAEEIKCAFDNTFYNPLFLTDNKISIYDYLCKLDLVRCGNVFYNSKLLKLAAMDEKRYDEAMFCLKCILFDYSPLANNIKDSESPNFSCANLLTDTIIDCMRDYNNSEVKTLIEEYDKIVDLKNKIQS